MFFKQIQENFLLRSWEVFWYVKDFVLSDKQIKSFTCIDFLLFYLYDRWVASFMNLMEDLFVKEATQWVLEQLRDFLSQLMWVFSCYLHVRHIPANPAYSVYISQLRYARICTSKVDFINRLCGLSLRPRQQGIETNLLQKSFNKFFGRPSRSKVQPCERWD